MQPGSLIIKPLITEKSLNQTKNNWYSFKVDFDSAKEQIKKEIETSFKVNVLEIKTVVIKGKVKKIGRGRKEKSTQNWKKAFVKIKPDQKISLFEEQGA